MRNILTNALIAYTVALYIAICFGLIIAFGYYTWIVMQHLNSVFSAPYGTLIVIIGLLPLAFGLFSIAYQIDTNKTEG